MRRRLPAVVPGASAERKIVAGGEVRCLQHRADTFKCQKLLADGASRQNVPQKGDPQVSRRLCSRQNYVEKLLPSVLTVAAIDVLAFGVASAWLKMPRAPSEHL